MNSATAETRLAALLRRLVEQFHQQRPLRTGSLLITVFGDVIYPRGGAVWLSDLLALMERFGLGQRLVRTSLTRLAQDDWFEIEQVGRRSVYRLSDTGTSRIRQASARIYGDPRHDWPGTWTLALLAGVPPDSREEVRRRLEALGMRAATANTFMAPASETLPALLEPLHQRYPLLVMHEAMLDSRSAERMSELILRAWDIEFISESYAAFIKQFQDLVGVPSSAGDDVAALLVRVMLVHHYRRLILRDPGLPATLLPSHWSGLRAYQLASSAYRSLLPGSERAVDRLLSTPWGALPPRRQGGHQGAPGFAFETR